MIIIPAIDIKNGKVVRLTQGKFDQETIYDQDPISVAKNWESQGAELIHIVDLDGAQTGEIANLDTILKIREAVKVPLEVGGGIRNTGTIDKLLNAGISRVILGTRAVEDPNFLSGILCEWDKQIAVSIDCANGKVTKKGWTETSDIDGKDLARQLANLELQTLIYTDIARDGVLVGPNIQGIKEMLSAINIPMIASGGISTLDDIKALASLNTPQLIGVIVGKALYEQKFTVKEAIAACSQNV
ncbi:MAG: 1-(5-phosphoribosyl)-5-[(5-phosphoribosylamino)methylideneamino]imidazole-4-carboxamide isomerase [Candidatus Aceula meridiana]|nr:1-(5-phosphoribosyl)-5-[(5-phosphoribosylamino)methylideneamino]imidazole-4-carboxamide isomerase [Candidatus Aceula meridiana]